MSVPHFVSELLPMPWNEMNLEEKKFTAALFAYVAGDAFGAYYEFSEIVTDVPNQLRKKDSWPLGSTSDDTALTVFTLLSISEPDPRSGAEHFLNLLRENHSTLRGLGPTTRSALGLSVREAEVSSIGLTNGALMRTALLGLIFSHQLERDAWVGEMARATHLSYAVEAAVDLANAFSGMELEQPDDWVPGNSGVSNDALETLAAVNYVVSRSESAWEAMQLACTIGGDTDTVSAISAALVTARSKEFESIYLIPWLNEIDWAGVPRIRFALQNAFMRMGKT